MRAHSRRLLTAGLALAALVSGLSLAPASAAAADEPSLNGTWKLVQLRLAEVELLSLDVKQTDDKITAFILEPAQLRDNPVKTFERKGDTVNVAFSVNGNQVNFTGRATKDNKYLGTISLSNQLLPAWLVKTDDKILAQPRPPEALFKALNSMDQVKDPKGKANKLAEIVHGTAGDARFSLLYADLLRYASVAEEPAATMRKYADEWMKSAEPHGPDWSEYVRTQVLKALSDKKPYADLALEWAEQAEKQFTPATTLEVRADVIKALASAAKLVGKPEILARAEAQSKKLESELDEDYHKKVPPFKPEVSEGRKGKAGDRVVLLELFTGAQCPPCVAADVAFDALNASYKPSELLTLQYHLHIPGPDPLTSPGAIARQEYYTDLRGTPAAYFNGRLHKGGGGGMAQSKAKYDEYREVVDTVLEQKKRATIELHVERAGDELKISASAQAKSTETEEKEDAKGEGKDKVADSKDGIRLRLVLAEEQIKYLGGNKLRFHHHVVRAMPGGADGKALSNGEGKVEVTVKLSEVRNELDKYLDSFVKENGGFPNPRPPIDLKNLTVVAFVQDDSNKAVLHAVSAPVADAKGEGAGE
ncbi:MAG: hypothetical protein P4L84_13860 [Isosphaeraceae bacterium]|nr:hypothetical protein [Isosphaeraceae bacterium]